jgi:hypothetical protein
VQVINEGKSVGLQSVQIATKNLALMIFRTGERLIPNTGRDLNTGVMHAARVVVSTRQQKIGNSILALQIRYKFVGKGQFCARHSLELIEQIFDYPDSLPMCR